MNWHRVLLAVMVLSLAAAPAMAVTLADPAYPLSYDETGDAEWLLHDIYNDLYGTGLADNTQLINDWVIDQSAIASFNLQGDELLSVEVEAAWMNAFFTQDLGVISNGVPDYTIIPPVTNAFAGFGDLRGLGLSGSFIADADFDGFVDYASFHGLDPGGEQVDVDLYWYTDAALNSDGDIHFLFFETPVEGEYLMAVEDLWYDDPRSHQDFNDIVFIMRESIVPEPASIGLLGLGIAGLAVTRLRKKQ